MLILYLKVLAEKKSRKWHHDIQVLWILCNLLIMMFHIKETCVDITILTKTTQNTNT